jgi:FkbH-like protein
MKVALLSNINMDLVKNHLYSEISLWEDVDIYFGGYGLVIQELINTESNLHSFCPDITLIFLDGDELFLDLLDSDQNELFEQVGNRVSGIANAIATYQSHFRNYILINSIVIRPFSINPYNNIPSAIENFANLKFREMSEGMSNYIIVDWHRYVKKHGYLKLYDIRYWYLARIKFSQIGMKEFARLCCNYIKAVKGKSKKLLILDLDNTLWGGIVGEDGPQGIELGEDGIGRAYRDFQQSIKDLKNQGILLAIVSKNNLSDVEEVFLKNPMMVLKMSDFVSIHANWVDKVQNIKELSEEISLGVDSFVFIDDNKFEREMIKNLLPDVSVPDFPEDPAFLPYWFCERAEEYFPRIYLTLEDKTRTDMYRAEIQRHKLRKETVNLEDFYHSLNMKVIIALNDQKHIQRIAQLTQRTNQFNLTTRRYTEEDIYNFMKDPNYYVFNFEFEDNFGTYGVTGSMIVQTDKESVLIDTFLMSCRIIGKDVEKAFLSYVNEFFRSRGHKRLIGEYIPTKKNNLVSNLYEKMGFQRIVSDGDRSMWELDITHNTIRSPLYIKIREGSDGKETF